ncbi:MAG: TonB-dependent receptor, partial [Acidobacteriota bacterium]|nr:TonB-dependent receptor [Acidobacteriota bacterium]
MHSIPSKPFSHLSRTAITHFGLFVCLIWLVLPGHSQTFRGTMHGRVVDPSGALLPNATVSAKNLNTGTERTAVTNNVGEYVLPELDAGRYEVTTAINNFQKTSQIIVVNVGADTEADIAIGKIGSTSETVEVSEQAPLINTERNVLGALVEDRLVQSLPLNGRDFGKLVALTPGVSVEGSGVAGTEKGFGQFNVNGNRDRSNNYLLDGTDNNDPFFNNSALNQVGITGAPASLLPLDAIQEFNIQSSYGAEYGRNAGGVVNVITKSGTNLFHGSIFDYLRNSAFDARNYFNTKINQNGAPVRQTSFRNNNFGGSLGGPIRNDKTFFFLAYEGQREAAGSDFLLTLPTADEIAQARSIAQANGAPVINPGLDKVLSFFPASNTGSLNSAVNDTNNLD